MSSEPQCHDTGGSYPPGPTSGSCGVEKEQLENIRDTDAGTDTSTDTSTDSTAASPSHHAQLGLATGTNNHEHEPQDQERSDDWTVEDLLDIQERRHQEILQEIRAANAEDRIFLNEAMGQNISTNLGLEFQRIEEFFTNWAEQFSQRNLVARVATLEQQLRLERQQRQQLGEEYKGMRTKYRNICAELDKALHERDEQRRLADGGTLANSSKATDDAILAKWKLLCYNIYTTAHVLAKNPPSKVPDQVAEARLDCISQTYQDHLQDEEYRELVFQGYLWVMVNDKVFEAGTRVWGGSGLADLKAIQDNLINRLTPEDAQERREMCQQVARWLAQGSGILNQLWGFELEGVKSLAIIETKRLMGFFSVQNTSLDGADKVMGEIRVIIECAAELDRMLMCSKALFRICWKDQNQSHSKPQRFNSSTMDSLCHENELTSESTVKMVISPFLYKAGNADGQNYESSMLLIKADVVCD